MRRLATIERIRDVRPVPDSDNLDVVTVRGWQVVVKREEFAVGDACVYFEIDSFLPVREEFEFLRRTSFTRMGDREGFRLRTLKLRGQVSQGLVVPLKTFTNGSIAHDLTGYEFGDDVTELLGVIQYDPPLPEDKNIIGGFPTGIGVPKTSLDRIQNVYDTLADSPFGWWEESIKLDGVSVTACYIDGKIKICTQNWEIDPTDTMYGFILESVRDKFMALDRNLAIQGELIGQGIRKNKEKILGRRWLAFDIWDVDNHYYLDPDERQALLNEFGLQSVPVLNEKVDIFAECPTLEDLLARADGESLHAAKREGLVYKSYRDEHGTRLSFKVINNGWLLKHGE